MKEKLYVKAIDSLRTLSILAVILIHTTTKVLEASHYNLADYGITLFLNQLARFAVPLFILISGFVLELNFHLNESYIHYFKKRASRILIPYLFWSIFYYFFIYTQNRDSFLKVILTGDASYQLYFIPTLAIYYLVFPLIHKIYKLIANKYVLIILTITECGFMYFDYRINQFNLPDPLRIFVLSYLFFVIGMIGARNKDKILAWVRSLKYFLVPIIIYLPFYIFKEGYNRYFKTYNIEAFYSQWRISVLVYTIILAILLFYLFDKSHLQFKLVEKVSKLSFFVFFVHVAILEATWKLIGKIEINQLLFDLLFFILVSTISFGIAFVLKKIPHLSKLTG